MLEAGQTIALTCDQSAQASSTLLPISNITTFSGTSVAVGSRVLVGQYLFSGSDTTSAYLDVEQVRACCLGYVPVHAPARQYAFYTNIRYLFGEIRSDTHHVSAPHCRARIHVYACGVGM